MQQYQKASSEFHNWHFNGGFEGLEPVLGKIRGAISMA